jgi:hypothetical protein
LWGNTGDNIFSIGNDTNTTTGNVGIGTATPSQNLHVTTPDLGFGNQTALQIGTGAGSLFLTHTSANISSNLRYDDGNWRYEAAGPGAIINMSPLNGDIVFQNAPTGAAGAAVTPTERMRITTAGNVGIGTTTPAVKLDVAGAVKVAGGAETCDATKGGAIRYNATSKLMEFCNETNWVPMGGGFSGNSWQNVSRSCGVTYTNTHSGPLMVAIRFTGNGGTGGNMTIGGVGVAFSAGFSANTNMGFTALVPAGQTYSLSCSDMYSLQGWSELRL